MRSFRRRRLLQRLLVLHLPVTAPLASARALGERTLTTSLQNIGARMGFRWLDMEMSAR